MDGLSEIGTIKEEPGYRWCYVGGIPEEAEKKLKTFISAQVKEAERLRRPEEEEVSMLAIVVPVLTRRVGETKEQIAIAESKGGQKLFEVDEDGIPSPRAEHCQIRVYVWKKDLLPKDPK